MTKRALTLDAILSDCVAASPHCSGNCCDARTPCRDNLHKRVGQPATGGFPGHDNIADAGLPDDKARREILTATPLDFHGTVLHRSAKPAFQLFQPVLDRSPPLIDQPLGRFAFREIERRTEFGGGNSDHPGTEPFRQLRGNFQSRVIWLAERQAHHHRLICHRSLRMPACFIF